MLYVSHQTDRLGDLRGLLYDCRPQRTIDQRVNDIIGIGWVSCGDTCRNFLDIRVRSEGGSKLCRVINVNARVLRDLLDSLLQLLVAKGNLRKRYLSRVGASNVVKSASTYDSTDSSGLLRGLTGNYVGIFIGIHE